MKPSLTLPVRAMFGLLDHADADPAPTLLPHARRLHAQLRTGQIALITGPSGAGKSSLARALSQLTPTTVPGNTAPSAPIIDLLTGPLPRRLSILSSVGLADAHLFLRHANHLSVGERARLDLALTLDAAARTRSTTLILDEFCSTLDRPTARLVARLLRRTITRTPTLRAFCLTAHDDLAPSLSPDLALYISPHAPRSPHLGPARWAEGRGEGNATPPATPSDPLIQLGTFADYTTLARHHYRPARPAILAGPHAVRRAIDPRTGELLAVLVLSMPTLNAPWRDIIWPTRYRTHDKPADARRISAELRTIARVIVAPAHRGLGIATALVRHYLANPLTPATEAVAAMGIASPFFAAAGMRPYRLPPTSRDSRLLDALVHLWLAPADLLDPVTPLPPLLLRELRHWANHSRATRHLLDNPSLAAHAAQAILSPRLVYAHVATNRSLAQEPPHAPLRKLAA